MLHDADIFKPDILNLEQYPEHTCKSCGNIFAGRYCNLCGEKVIEPKDRKLDAYLSKVLIATTIVDNKFVKSLWLIIKNPGFLSREYVDGRRVNYMRPLQIFFILNLIYFFGPLLQMFNSSLRAQMYVLPHAKLARQIVLEKVKAYGMNLEGFQLVYDDKTKSLAKLLIVIFIFLAAVPLSVIFRKKNRYFTDHVALSVELTCFNLAVNTIALTILFGVINKVLHLGNFGGGNYLNDITLTVLFVSTNLYFLFRAAGTFYNQRGSRQIIRVVLGILGLFLALEAYRFILFFVTIWSL